MKSLIERIDEYSCFLYDSMDEATRIIPRIPLLQTLTNTWAVDIQGKLRGGICKCQSIEINKVLG